MKIQNPFKLICSCCALLLLMILANAVFAQTLTTDAPDYAPGSTVTLSGSGFGSGETVTVQVLHNPTGGDDATSPDHQPWNVTADDDGNFTTTWHVPDDQDELGASLIANADGQSSGAHADATFTDGPPQGTGVPSISGGCSSQSAQNSNVYNLYVAEGGSYHFTMSNVTECSGDHITVNVQSSSIGNWCFDATKTSDGVYEADITIPNPACLTMPISYSCGYPTNCGNEGDYAATGPGGEPQVHFSITLFDADCNNLGHDENCNSTTCTVSIDASSSSACLTNCATLTASGGTSYVWSPGGATTSTISVCSSGTYTVTANDGACSATTTLDPCQCPPMSCSITGDETIPCGGGSHVYSVSPTNCVGTPTYSWTVTGDATISGATDQNSVTVVAASVCNGTYTVTCDVSCTDCNGNASGSECSKTATIDGGGAPVLSGCGSSDVTEKGCNPTTSPACSDWNVTASNGCGPVNVDCQPGSVTTNGCNRYQDITYSATACGQTSSCTHHYHWTVVTAPVFNCSGGTTNLGCNATLPSCTTANVTAHNECGSVDVNCAPGTITNTGCSHSQSFVYSASACGLNNSITKTYTWKDSTAISISIPNPLPVCGISGYTLSVTNNGPGTLSTYSWSVSGGNGWAIVGATTNSSITYTAGSGGTQGTFSVTVTNSCGCSSRAKASFGTNCTEACGYTQGFYGGTGKDCSNANAQTVMTNVLTSSGGFTAGAGTHTICYLTSGCTNGTAAQLASCIGGKLPSGTTPSQLPSGSPNCAGTSNSTYLNNGKYKDVLLGQVIALWFNTHNGSSLCSLKVTGPYVTTYQATACTNGKAKPGTKLVKGPIPSSVMTYMNTNYPSGWTVGNLWTEANKALGNGSTTPSLPDWTSACDIFNNGFDGCRILAGFGSSSSGVKEADQLDQPSSATSGDLENMSIYPNPATDQVNVSFTSSSDMNVTIDIYNVNGVLVDRVVSGVFATGESSLVHIDASQLAQGVYFIRIIQGDKTAIGKFILAR